MSGLLTRVMDGAARAAGRVVAETALARSRMRGDPGPGVETQESSIADQFVSIIQGNAASGTVPHKLSPAASLAANHRWQYAAVDAIASAMMMIEWSIEGREGDAWVTVEGHPLGNLLQNINPFMTGPEFRYWASAECLFTGRSHWQIVLNSLGEPAELWPLIGKVTPIIKKGDPLPTGWRQEVLVDRGHIIVKKFAPEEVMFLRLPQVGSLYGGYGPVQAAGSSIELDRKIVESEWAAFKQGVNPSPILMMSEPNAQNRKALLTEFQDRYAGAQRTGLTVGLGKTMDLKWPPNKLRDMGYKSGAEQTRDEVLGVMRTPEAILGKAENVNRASAVGMEYIFAKWRISPLLTLFDARMNQDLADRFFENTRIASANPVPADEAQVLEQREVNARLGIHTRNELRERDGLEPVEGGDVLLVPAGLVPITDAGLTEPADDTDSGDAQSVAQSPDAMPTDTTQPPEPVVQGFTFAQRRRLAARAAIGHARIEARLTRAMVIVFSDLEREILAAWDLSEGEELSLHRLAWRAPSGRVILRLPRAVDQILTPQVLAGRIATQMKPHVKWGITLGGSFEQGLMSVPDDFPWHEGIAAIDQYAVEFGETHFLGTAQTTRQEFVDVVRAGIVENESFDQIRLRIVEKFGEMKSSRATLIGVTESTKLYSAGGAAFRDTYEVPFKMWVAQFVNTRDTHAAADGQTIKNAELFVVGGDQMRFPGDGFLAEENCNCGCIAVGVLEAT